MLTSKERAQLRGQATTLDTTLMVGKGGITEALIAEADNQLTARELGEYWLAYIPPHWNEYGIGKANMKSGILPPLCGEYNNAFWRHSNGAWIRSEVWACLAPGFPNVAIKYAIMDASVDHGLSEGTHAEVFTAVLESLAFFESDVRKLYEELVFAVCYIC